MRGPNGGKTKNVPSMRGLMMASMCGLLVLSFCLLFVILQFMGLMSSLNDTAYRTLNNFAEGNVSLLSSDMIFASRSARFSANQLGIKLNNLLLREGTELGVFADNEALLDEALHMGLSAIEEYMDNTPVTGAFLVLNTSYTDEAHLAGIYLRDPTPETVSNVYEYRLLRGPKTLSGNLAEQVDENWAYELSREEAAPLLEAPLGAVLEHAGNPIVSLGYWSAPFRMDGSGARVITYSIPIIDGAGLPLGVFGVELSEEYLISLLQKASPPFKEGFFLIAKLDESGAIVSNTAIAATAQGRDFLRYWHGRIPPQLESDAPEGSPVYTASGPEENVYYALETLNLYGLDSPFAGQGYYLVAAALQSQVLLNSNSIFISLALSIGLSLLIAILGALFISRYFSLRIERLAAEVAEVNPEQPVRLSKTNIREIDTLSEMLKKMGEDIAGYSARMSNIVDMVGIPMGAFDVQEEYGRVYFTESLFRLLRLPRESSSSYIPMETFRALFYDVELPPADGMSAEVEINWKDREQWFQLRLRRKGKHVYGTVIDITDEVRARHSLEYERDYDPLTKLLNRNSYPRHMSAMIDRAPDKKGVLLFGDLDNLKYINDTFGHDMGDRYIQMAAAALKLFERQGGAVARISGDEFAVYLHGETSKKALRERIDATIEEVRRQSMPLPDDSVQKVRISIGLAYYPDDATSIDRLVRYADFAMYEVKHSAKGGTREFDQDSYTKNSFILNKPSHLDRLIEHGRVTFAFQPIIDVRTGNVFGYEALMRPLIREMHSPQEVLALAKSQSKLYQVERLTLTHTFDWLSKNRMAMQGRKLFINLIANQVLSDADMLEVYRPFPDAGDTVVMEITESESDQEGTLMDKVRLIRAQGGELALDDYGSGYNSEVTLLKIAPDYIKIDMSIIRNIHKDTNRQKMMRQIVEYSQDNNIRVIAEGVESREELRMVIDLGADLIQGYYTGKPEYALEQQDVRACREVAEIYRELYIHI